MIASSFLAYLWHYVLARLIYDVLVRGPGLAILLALLAGVVLLLLARRRSRP